MGVRVRIGHTRTAAGWKHETTVEHDGEGGVDWAQVREDLEMADTLGRMENARRNDMDVAEARRRVEESGA